MNIDLNFYSMSITIKSSFKCIVSSIIIIIYTVLDANILCQFNKLSIIIVTTFNIGNKS